MKSTAVSGDYTLTENERPPENVVVETVDRGGCVRDLIFDSGLWWFTDRSMYVYFVPLFWKHKP